MLRLCRHQGDTAGAVVDSLERFPNVYCPICKRTQSWFFYVAKGNAYLDHDCADIVCSGCKTVLLSLHSGVALAQFGLSDGCD